MLDYAIAVHVDLNAVQNACMALTPHDTGYLRVRSATLPKEPIAVLTGSHDIWFPAAPQNVLSGHVVAQSYQADVIGRR